LSDIFLSGAAVMTPPPTTGAIFQLVDPTGTIIHEYAAMPVGTVRRIERVVFKQKTTGSAWLLIQTTIPYFNKKIFSF
jgi:hypothetical protein